MKVSLNQNQLLDDKIRLLQNKRSNDLLILKSQFVTTKENLNPLNLIKGTISDLKGSSRIKNSLLESAVGIASGYLTKRLLIGKSTNIFKKISGAVLQYAVSNFITNKAEKINSHEKDI